MTKRKGFKNNRRAWIAAGVVAAWVLIIGIGGPSASRLSKIANNDPVSFLPASSESTQAQAAQTMFLKTKPLPAIVVLESAGQLNKDDFTGLTNKLKSIKGVDTSSEGVLGPYRSKDKHGLELIVQVSDRDNVKTVVKDIRAAVQGAVPTGVTGHVTGPAGLTVDHLNAFAGIDGILVLAALGAVFIILLLVYRSVVLPFLVLTTAMFALSAAQFAIYIFASRGTLSLNGQSQGILSILVIGAATDYALLVIARYREALPASADKWAAVIQAVKNAFEPVAASAATVILALLCLLFSNLNSNRTLGPVAALGITFALAASLTLLPALLGLLGKAAFWPFIPRLQHASAGTGLWHRTSSLIARHPRRVWILALVLLGACLAGLPQLRAHGVAQTATLLAKSDAVDGQAALGRHFPAGAGSPVIAIISKSHEPADLTLIASHPDIASATPQDVVFNDLTLVNATLRSAADSDRAIQTVRELRTGLRQIDNAALVGGETATALDTTATSQADLWVVVPLALLVILAILILLLRSVLAPVLLIASVILSYGATLGVSALVFNHIFHFPGADAAIPLFGFIFLVALGVDYNIFLMTRVREEALQLGTRRGILKGLSVTGGVITSAGIVLAATFAALGVIPILYLAQIAFIVAFGVLLDTVIVRSLLVPALAYDLGEKIWWPVTKVTR